LQVVHAAEEGARGSRFLGLSAENYSPRPECGSIFSYQQMHNSKRQKKKKGALSYLQISPFCGKYSNSLCIFHDSGKDEELVQRDCINYVIQWH
jgi:hypothetical protein